MSEATPNLSLPLKNLLQGLAEQAPIPILPMLSGFARELVTEDDLVEFVQQAPPNDPGMIQLRLALAKWDASDNLKLPGVDGQETGSGTIARRVAVVKSLGLSDSAETVLREKIPVYVEGAIVISKEFKPWYEEVRHQRSTMYWDHYEKYLAQEKKWPAPSINTIDQSTNAIVERLANPTCPDIKRTKGLVVGYVQSGKTANFTGVIAKAIDAGYRLVIVMTGTIEILRAQTQRRIDMELMGVENVLAGQDPKDPEVAKGLDYQQDEEWLADRFVRHSQQALDQPGVARIRRVTTHKGDYKSLPHGMSQLRYERHDKTKPLNAEENLFHTDAYVVIVKKNSAPLKKLIKDLKPMRDTLNELPALIIDDESDVASVNTKDPKKSKDRTIINKLITEILELVPRAQYVGYTATPFANVLIDPDETDKIDLFPSDFVLSLPRPPQYMGVQEFHDIDPEWENTPKTMATSNELAFIRAVSGGPDVDPVLHRDELRAALDAWVLSGAIKKFREAKTGRTFRHHTMLVHEDVRNAMHLDSASVVRGLWNTGKFTSGEGLSRLRKLFDDDYAAVMVVRADAEPVPASFDELKPYVPEAVAEMTSSGADPVLVVNSDKNIQDQQQALDFDKSRVWRVLVGGTKLSRGFTVEGLTISYFRRKAGQADTLMQAGRWFGFREGYRDLVRLYIRRDHKVDLYEAFEALLLDEEAFRDELGKYAGLDEDNKPIVEPRHIPPLVSQHLPWLKPTARNKMFNAVVKARASVGAFHQLSSIPPREEKAKHKHNLETVVLPLLKLADKAETLPYVDGTTRQQHARVGLVDAAEFLALFDQLIWHQDYQRVIDPLRAFIVTATEKKRIRDWAIIWPQRAVPGRELGFEELSVPAPIFKRSRRQAPRIDFTGENKRNILAAERVPAGESLPGIGKSDTRGVLVISLVADREEKSEAEAASRQEIVGMISLRVPDKSIQSKRELIQYGVVIPDKADEVAVDVDAQKAV
ncbi:Z1 domain-containing protein [Thiohalomonas denitrificans]|uniref:Z1 domain-containing protein n=1 Tax=Thiohalomonas denitrificans TaxID=415747 RepID=A0A1G5QT67_9GAMM|nr:Z1 domain-containing protein [Thiohalomonas denitrificans]SCZ64740.1 Z1 domain-containing protein [Thiohalomonas denitrificans]